MLTLPGYRSADAGRVGGVIKRRHDYRLRLNGLMESIASIYTILSQSSQLYTHIQPTRENENTKKKEKKNRNQVKIWLPRLEPPLG